MAMCALTPTEHAKTGLTTKVKWRNDQMVLFYTFVASFFEPVLTVIIKTCGTRKHPIPHQKTGINFKPLMAQKDQKDDKYYGQV
eukprot:4134932-Amphidinium_carterae.1